MRAPRLPTLRGRPSLQPTGRSQEKAAQGSIYGRGLRCYTPPHHWPLHISRFWSPGGRIRFFSQQEREAAAPLMHPTLNTASTVKRWKEKTTNSVQTVVRERKGHSTEPPPSSLLREAWPCRQETFLKRTKDFKLVVFMSSWLVCC